jgi:hypothetical protein
MIAQMDNAFAHAKGISNMVIHKVESNRYYLSPTLKDSRTFLLQKTTLGWSTDIFFGSSFFSKQSETLFRMQESFQTTSSYNPNLKSNGYLTFRIKQFSFNSVKKI